MVQTGRGRVEKTPFVLALAGYAWLAGGVAVWLYV